MIGRWPAIGLCLAVSACGGMSVGDLGLPSLSLSGGAPTADLRIESEPAGADARASSGANCRTPCVLSVPASQQFTITLSMSGYQPQTIPVTPREPADMRPDETGIPAVQLDPNPVLVQLEPVPPPAPPKTRKPAPAAPKRAAAAPAASKATAPWPSSGSTAIWPRQ